MHVFLFKTGIAAYADSLDEITRRYRGLRCGQATKILEDDFLGLLVKSEVAENQRKEDTYSKRISDISPRVVEPKEP